MFTPPNATPDAEYYGAFDCIMYGFVPQELAPQPPLPDCDTPLPNTLEEANEPSPQAGHADRFLTLCTGLTLFCLSTFILLSTTSRFLQSWGNLPPTQTAQVEPFSRFIPSRLDF